jgi:flagellar assembly protein FliH
VAVIRPFSLGSFDKPAPAPATGAAPPVVGRGPVPVRDPAAGREAGYREGYQAGKAEALEAEKKRLAAETAALRELLKRIARLLYDQRAQIVAEGERELVRLAVAVAEKIVKAEVKSGARVAERNVRRAVELVARRQQLFVKLHPQDQAAVEAFLPELQRELADIGTVQMVPSPDVERGGCVVAGGQGTAEAEIETQLREIEKGLAE